MLQDGGTGAKLTKKKAHRRRKRTKKRVTGLKKTSSKVKVEDSSPDKVTKAPLLNHSKLVRA